MNIEPHPETIQHHLDALFYGAAAEYSDGLVEIAWSGSGGKLCHARMFPITPDGLKSATDHAVQVNVDGVNIYVGVNPRKPGTPHKRAASNSIEVAFFNFADLDDGTAVAALPERSAKVPCTFAVITGRCPTPRLHAYWRLEEPVRNLPVWERQQAALAAHFNGDAVQDPPRVMRLAGTVSYPSDKKVERGYQPEFVTLQNGEDRDAVDAHTLAAVYPPIQASTPTSAMAKLANGLGLGAFDVEACLAEIAAGHDLHNNSRDLAAHLVHKRYGDFFIRDYLKRVLTPVSDGGTIDEIPDLIVSARQKWDIPDAVTPDMSMVDGGRHPAPAMPLEPYGPWGDWIAAHAEGCSAPIDYVAGGLLAGASSLIGNSRWISPWAGWREPAALWIALVGNPSSGKSPALDAALDLLRTLEGEMAVDFPDTMRQHELDREAAKAKRETWQGEVKTAVKDNTPPPEMPESAVEPEPPIRPRLHISDTTVEAAGKLLAAHPRGLLYQRDELSGWLGNFDRYGGGGGDRAFWVESFGGRPFVIDRVKHGQEPIRIPHLSVSAVGGIQPDRLASLFMTGDDDGLAARFLMAWPTAVTPRRPRAVPDDGPALTATRRLLHLRMGTDDNGNPSPVIIHLDNDAAELFQEWREDNATRETDASGLYLSHIGKLPGMVLRLALVLEFLWWAIQGNGSEPETVGAAATGYAAHLADVYFIPMARRVYGDAALPEPERHAAAIARRILRERPDVVNASHIRRVWKLPGLRAAGKVNAAIKALEEAVWLLPAPSREGTKPGRQKADYQVNAQVYETAK
jgi:hypothetical protein